MVVDQAVSQQVEHKPVSKLTRLPNSPRVHSIRQIKLLKRSIELFGFVNPILIDTKCRVIAGWGRVLAAQALQLREVPTLRIHHLNEDELRAYVIADNRLADKGGWDRELLALELQGLNEIGFDIEAIGFENAELDIILEEAKEARGGDSAEDRLFEISNSVITQPNDLWSCGRHKLLCGDAREAEAYKRILGSDKAALVITDPPYNVQIKGNVSGLGRHQHAEFAMASGEMTSTEFSSFLSAAIEKLIAYSEDGSVHFIFMDWRHIQEMMLVGQQHYSKLLNLCVWCKTNAGMGSFYRSQHELVFAWHAGNAAYRNNIELGRHGRSRSNVWTYAGVNTFKKDRDQELSMHPTVKPIALIADAIKDCSVRDSIILDPFVGSGTTLIAAEQTGRIACGIEIDPRYVDVAIRRWQAYTGKMAIHVETGRTFEEIEASCSKKRSRR
ncbi:MAG: site-specific DNA-methyltransferase [Xanthobacteraceae bacterium]|nr:site-specific DNA-methyltransferase [Xanthobacteraceae bacterium]QYK46568.1 MAG: site-specific DNA-methyltransferase [Xanthobacteraceae bacterium]